MGVCRQGPPGVGKTTLIKSLVKHYTRHVLSEVRGPINIVSGKVLYPLRPHPNVRKEVSASFARRSQNVDACPMT